MRLDSVRIRLLVAAVALCLVPACRNQGTRPSTTIDPTKQTRPSPGDLPAIMRDNPDAEIQGGRELQEVNSLIGQWDLAKSEGMANEAARVASRIRAEVDGAYPAFVDAAEGRKGVATQYLGTSALGFSANPGATAIIVKRLYERDERLVANALVALNERADPSTPLGPVLRYVDERAPLLARRYAPLVFASVYAARQQAGNPVPREQEQTALPRLISVANDKDGYTRLHVTKALGRLAPTSESAVDALLLRLEDEQMRVRWAAAAVLERSGNPRGFPGVVRLLHEVPAASKHIIRDVLVSYAARLQGYPLSTQEVEALGYSGPNWSRWFARYREGRGLDRDGVRLPSTG